MGAPMSGPTLEVIVLAAEGLKNVNILRKMSVYAVAWVAPDYKRTTSVHSKAGRNPFWNDALSFPVTDDILLHPCSALTIQVRSHVPFPVLIPLHAHLKNLLRSGQIRLPNACTSRCEVCYEELICRWWAAGV